MPRRYLLLLAAISLLATFCTQCDRSKQAQTEPAPAISVWYGNQQSFGKLGKPQRWINILGNVSGTSVESLTYSLNGGAPIALAVGPSLTPPGVAPCSEVPPKASQDAASVSGNNFWNRLDRFWRDCKSDSFARCAERHVSGWVFRRSNNGPPLFPRRLSASGDFNVELDVDDLHEGPNILTLTAINEVKHSSTTSVRINYTKGQTWPLPYYVDWSRISDVSQAVQIIDGRWIKTAEGVRTAEIGYDRLFAVGDVKWTDYEITVPIKVHSIDYQGSNNPVSGGSGFGMITHWRGHSYDPFRQCECSQPRCGWFPDGGSWWYSFWSYSGDPAGFQIQDVAGAWVSTAQRLNLNTWYVLKTRSQKLDGNARYKYSMKFWKLGDEEPAKWDLEGTDAANNSASGSIVLDAHHVDATFGNISVIPGPFSDTERVAATPVTRCEAKMRTYPAICP